MPIEDPGPPCVSMDSLGGLSERSCSPSSPIKWTCCGWCNDNNNYNNHCCHNLHYLNSTFVSSVQAIFKVKYNILNTMIEMKSIMIYDNKLETGIKLEFHFFIILGAMPLVLLYYHFSGHGSKPTNYNIMVMNPETISPLNNETRETFEVFSNFPQHQNIFMKICLCIEDIYTIWSLQDPVNIILWNCVGICNLLNWGLLGIEILRGTEKGRINWLARAISGLEVGERGISQANFHHGQHLSPPAWHCGGLGSFSNILLHPRCKKELTVDCSVLGRSSSNILLHPRHKKEAGDKVSRQWRVVSIIAPLW